MLIIEVKHGLSSF